MKDETQSWLRFAEENLKSAQILLTHHLYNSCLQNIQQSVEKTLKSIVVEKGMSFQKTHNILELRHRLTQLDVHVDLSDDDCDFLDAIYLPSKYPFPSVYPDYDPDEDICAKGIKIASDLLKSARSLLK